MRRIEARAEPSAVAPAQAGAQGKGVANGTVPHWIPAFAGMTIGTTTL